MTSSGPSSPEVSPTRTAVRPSEPSVESADRPTAPMAGLTLSRSAVDRAYLRREDPLLFDHLWSDPRTRIVVLHDGKTLTTDQGLRFFGPEEATAGNLRFFLGEAIEGDPAFAAGTPFVGLVLSDRGAEELEADPTAWKSLRDIGEQLGDRDSGLLTTVLALANWHSTHTHSPRSGAMTIPEQGGWVRRDPGDGSQHFPRTDPAVIMTVVHEDADGVERLLLAHNAAWPAERFSTLAGFVEPGESLEAAVIREVAEETGIVVSDPRYLGSQPWPFPCSLMLGFTARADSTAISVDSVEILDARWFTRDELVDAVRSGEVVLPGKISIARRLIDTWLGRPLS